MYLGFGESIKEMKDIFNSCMFKGCDIKLREEYDRWYLHINGQLKVYCEKHYNRLEKKVYPDD